MAVKKVLYKESDDYFTPSMLRVAENWEKEQAKKKAQAEKTKSKTKKQKKRE